MEKKINKNNILQLGIIIILIYLINITLCNRKKKYINNKEKIKSINKSNILKLILIRHAESEENIRFEALRKMFVNKKEKTMSFRKAIGVFQHKYRNSSLTPRGFAMAKNIKKQIKEADKLPWNQIDEYWHSPLQRTIQTISNIFPDQKKKFKQKDFLYELKPIELMPIFVRSFKKRVTQFTNELANLDDSIQCLVVVGHGIFFKYFLKNHINRKIKNAEVIVCDFDRNNKMIMNASSVFLPIV